MQIDLLNKHLNSGISLDNNQSELINMFLRPDNSIQKTSVGRSQAAFGGEYKLIACPTPGLSLFGDTGEAVVRAMAEHNDVLYIVAGNKFGSMSSNGTFTQIGGNLSTSTGFAQIEVITGSTDNNNQIVVIDGTFGYSYNIGTATATFPISDSDFPDTATYITSQDDYIIAEVSGSIRFQLSGVSDTLTWDALDFASKTGKADRLVAIKSMKRELWLMGSKTTEVWTNTGNSSFPFERRTDVFIEEGCAAKESVVIAADRLFYLARAKNGGYKIVSIDNYEVKRISDEDIEYIIGEMSTVSDCKAYSYYLGGKEFIDFAFPTANKTFTLDLTTGVFTKRESYVSSTYGRFLGNCSAFCYGKSLIGDYNSGKVYQQSVSVYTDNSVAIRRRITSPTIYVQGKRLFISRLQIDVQTNVGSSKTFDLEMSTDRGKTWESIQTFTVAESGDGALYTTSLGSAYSFIFRLTTTDDFDFKVLGFQAEATIGRH